MSSSSPTSSPFDAGILSADVPMQLQIYRQLRAEILDGLWIGRDFPGEREVAERFGVSVITARTALERLGREELVDRGRGRRGRATYIPPETKAAAFTMFPPPEGPSPLRYKLVSSGIDIAPADACRAFGLPPGSELWQAVRTTTFGGKVQAVTHNAQLPDLGQRHGRRALNSRPMVALLRAEGVDVARLRRRMQATTPPPVVAHHLGLSLDSAVLMIVVHLEDSQQHTVEWMRAFSHPDRPPAEEVLDLATGLWANYSDD
jgi:GntR family transcriptional regulator